LTDELGGRRLLQKRDLVELLGELLAAKRIARDDRGELIARCASSADGCSQRSTTLPL
jgi:hypothetical protein